MESFFKKHFRRKIASSGPQRTSVVALPASRARRRSVVGQPSTILVERRRRSSAQLQEMSCLGSSRKRRLCSRRRSSTTTPCMSPRFSVQKKRGGHVHTIDTHLIGPSLLLASLIQVYKEEERRQSHCTESSSSGSPKDGMVDSDWSEEALSSGSEGTEFEKKELQTECSLYPIPPIQHVPDLRPFLRDPYYLRRRSSHLLPAEFVHSRAAYGLQGRYRYFNQRRCSSETLKPSALLQPCSFERAARRWKVPVGTSWLPLSTHKCLGVDPALSSCGSNSSEGCNALLTYVWLIGGSKIIWLEVMRGEGRGVGRRSYGSRNAQSDSLLLETEFCFHRV